MRSTGTTQEERKGRLARMGTTKRGARRTSRIKPVRRITNFGRKVIGKFPSVKTGRPVWSESPLERDYIFLLEFDPDVVFYREQPLRLHYLLDGTVCTYTPDFLVERSSGAKQIVEVKPEKVALGEEYGRFSRAVASVCEKEGYEFLTATEKLIRTQPRLDNVKLLHRYARATILPQHLIECRRFFIECRKPSLGLLAEYLSAKGIAKQVAYALVHQGVVTADLNAPLTVASPVTWSPRFDSAEKAIPA